MRIVHEKKVQKKRILLSLVSTGIAVALTYSGAVAQEQGVTDKEIVLGSILDLSGPLASIGKQTELGMRFRIDEINANGGIHGRQIKIIIEDSGYDPKRAVLAAQKLVNRDEVFATVGNIGTAQNNAALPVLMRKKVFNFLPLSASRNMFEPVDPLKYAFIPPYYEQMRVMTPKLVKDNDIKTTCVIYQDDEFGSEIMRGGEAGLKELGMEYAEKTTYKRGATDFSSQIAKMKAANCEFVVLGTIIRETVGAIAEAKKIGFDPIFLVSLPGYTYLIHKLGGEGMNGLYAAHTIQIPYVDDKNDEIRKWAKSYQAKFDGNPTAYSVLGYTIINTFAHAAEKAGAELSRDGFIKAMETVELPADIFGGPKFSFSADNHLSSSLSRLSQIVDGKWEVVSDYVTSD